MKFSTAVSLSLLPGLTQADPYGHGTHVASIAAGSGGYQSPDSSGIASNADIYDVRVLACTMAQGSSPPSSR